MYCMYDFVYITIFTNSVTTLRFFPAKTQYKCIKGKELSLFETLDFHSKYCKRE